jgi:hypothetical protein
MDEQQKKQLKTAGEYLNFKEIRRNMSININSIKRFLGVASVRQNSRQKAAGSLGESQGTCPNASTLMQ